MKSHSERAPAYTTVIQIKPEVCRLQNERVQWKNVIIFFSSRKEAPDIPYNLTVTDSRNKTTTVNYVPDTLSNLYGWMVLLLDKETYVLTFDNPLASKQLQVTWEFFIISKLYLEEIIMLSSFWVSGEREKSVKRTEKISTYM